MRRRPIQAALLIYEDSERGGAPPSHSRSCDPRCPRDRCSDLRVRRISGSTLIMKRVYEQFRDALSHCLKMRDYSELACFSALRPL